MPSATVKNHSSLPTPSGRVPASPALFNVRREEKGGRDMPKQKHARNVTTEDMPEKKYAANIITEDLMPPQPAGAMKMMEKQAKAGRTLYRTMLLGIQDSIVKGAFFAGCEWLWELTGNGPVAIETPHTHDFDEIIGFPGPHRNHPRARGGERGVWVG